MHTVYPVKIHTKYRTIQTFSVGIQDRILDPKALLLALSNTSGRCILICILYFYISRRNADENS